MEETMKTNLKSLITNCIYGLLLATPKVTAVLVRLMMVVLIVSSLHLAGCKSDKKLAPAKMGSATSQEPKKVDADSHTSLSIEVRDENGSLTDATLRIKCDRPQNPSDKTYSVVAGMWLILKDVPICYYGFEVRKSGYLSVIGGLDFEKWLKGGYNQKRKCFGQVCTPEPFSIQLQKQDETDSCEPRCNCSHDALKKAVALGYEYKYVHECACCLRKVRHP